jgi:hypothetical protein
MGTSYVEYRGEGFWCRDFPLQCWLALLLDVFSGESGLGLASLSPAAREDWSRNVRSGGSGMIDPELDTHAAEAPARDALLAASAEARRRIARAEGKDLVRMVEGQGLEGVLGVDGETLIRLCLAAEALLRGELRGKPNQLDWQHYIGEGREFEGSRALARLAGESSPKGTDR